MSDALGNPGELVAEVDPDVLKAFWQEMAIFEPDIRVSMLLSVLNRKESPGQ
jgi:hypothetical protein